MRITLRTGCLVAATLLGLALVVGCGSGGSGTDGSAASSGSGGSLTSRTVVVEVDGSAVYWPEFRFWLKNAAEYYKASYGLDEITDWSVEQNGMPLEEFLRSSAAQQAAKGRAIEAQAAKRDIELTEDDRAEIAAEREKNISIYGSESEYLRILAGMYYTEEVYTYLQRVDYLTLGLFNEIYGKNGEKCTDDQVAAYVRQTGLMCATYVFLSDTTDDGSALSPDDKAKNRALLEDLVSRLDLSADPISLFDSLVTEYNQDPELAAFPDGRLFAPGVIGQEFEGVCAALGENQYSEVVESAAGLYLILRLPIHADMAADSAGNTLRYRTAYDYLFQKQVDAWVSEMDIEYEDAHDEIEVQGLFD